MTKAELVEAVSVETKMTKKAASEMIDVTVFSVSAERYGVETRYVRRVVKSEGCTPVPGTPAALRGGITVR